MAAGVTVATSLVESVDVTETVLVGELVPDFVAWEAVSVALVIVALAVLVDDTFVAWPLELAGAVVFVVVVVVEAAAAVVVMRLENDV